LYVTTIVTGCDAENVRKKSSNASTGSSVVQVCTPRGREVALEGGNCEMNSVRGFRKGRPGRAQTAVQRRERLINGTDVLCVGVVLGCAGTPVQPRPGCRRVFLTRVRFLVIHACAHMSRALMGCLNRSLTQLTQCPRPTRQQTSCTIAASSHTYRTQRDLLSCSPSRQNLPFSLSLARALFTLGLPGGHLQSRQPPPEKLSKVSAHVHLLYQVTCH